MKTDKKSKITTNFEQHASLAAFSISSAGFTVKIHAAAKNINQPSIYFSTISRCIILLYITFMVVFFSARPHLKI